MYDSAKLKYYKMFIDLLSENVDPVTNENATEETLQSPEVIKCLKYVSEILNNELSKNEKKASFFITEEQCSQVVISDVKMKISEIANEFNRVTESNGTKKLQAALINDWLESDGMLYKSENGSRAATEKGNEIGITSDFIQREDGKEYYLNFYSSDAQRYILSHIYEIIEMIPETNAVSEKNIVSSISIPEGMTIKQFINQNRNKCFIMSIGSCDAIANQGSYKSVLYFNGKTKVFNKTNIETSSSNRCILYGLIDAANAMKSPADIVILSSTSLGFNTRKSVNHSLCLELIEILEKIGCTVKICDCKRGYELKQIVDSF